MQGLVDLVHANAKGPKASRLQGKAVRADVDVLCHLYHQNPRCIIELAYLASKLY